MALRKSSRSILKLSSVGRRGRGYSGGGLSVSAPTLYDLEYRQMTEDYSDGIISIDEYINFLNNKLAGLAEGTQNRFTIEKRIKDVTNAYNKKEESLYNSKLAEDYRDGLVGYAAYSEYLAQRLETLDPNSADYFNTQKKLDDITFQQIDKQMDFGFKVSKNISPDNYISWKEQQLENIDPGSEKFMQLQSDIKSAKTEKINREKAQLEFDILTETKNKQDLAKFYYDTANASEDPEAQMRYYGLYSNTIDGINADILKQEREARALEEKEMRLKFNRGDLGNSFDENINAYYNFLAGQYESEFDPSRQMTYMSQMDSLTKQYEDYQEGKIKKGEAAGAAAEKEMKDNFYKLKKETNKQIGKMEKDLNAGIITPDEYAQNMMELIMGDDGYLKNLGSMYSVAGFDLGEIIGEEYEKVGEKFETDAFWKANIPNVDSEGKWKGNFMKNPSFKIVQNFNEAGNMTTKYIHDPGQSFEMEGHIYDREAGVYRPYKIVESVDEKGNKIKTKEIYRLDKDGNTVKDTFNEETKQWMTEFGEAKKYRDVNMDFMNDEEKSSYIQKQNDETKKQLWEESFAGKVPGVMKPIAKGWEMISKEMTGKPESALNKLADIGGGIKQAAGGLAAKSPAETARDIISAQKENVMRSAGQLPENLKTIFDAVQKSAGKKIGDVGEDIKLIQRNLNLPNITGYFGPKTQVAVEKATEQVKNFPAQIQQQLSSDFNQQTFGNLGGDIAKLGGVAVKGITSAAQKMFAPAQAVSGQNQIGGALGDVYAKRTDLQKVFDSSGKGTGAWAGKTIQDWAEMYGSKEESSLKGFKKTPQTMPQLKLPTLGGVKQQVSSAIKPYADLFSKAKSTLFHAPKAASSQIQKDYNWGTFNKLGSDAGKVSKHVSSAASNWLKKLKWW